MMWSRDPQGDVVFSPGCPQGPRPGALRTRGSRGAHVDKTGGGRHEKSFLHSVSHAPRSTSSRERGACPVSVSTSSVTRESSPEAIAVYVESQPSSCHGSGS